MPALRECYCRKCKGALVSKSTLRRHASKNYVSEPIMSFSEWSTASNSKQHSKDSEANESDSEDSDDNRAKGGSSNGERPLTKRPRHGIEPSRRVGRSLMGADNSSMTPPLDDLDYDEPEDPGEDTDILTEDNNPDNQLDNGRISPASQASDDPGSLLQQELQEHIEEVALRAAALLAQSQRDSVDDDSENDDSSETLPVSRIENINTTLQFIHRLREATLDNSGLDESDIHRLRNPLEHLVDISDPDDRLALELYILTSNSSEETYNGFRDALHRRVPDIPLRSLYSVKKLVSEITGVISVQDDMCINSCHAFTGPFADLTSCNVCGESRYDQIQLELTHKKVPRQQACTILLGPQIQARRRSEETSIHLRYRDQKMQEYTKMCNELQTETGEDILIDDIVCGGEFMDLGESINLSASDSLVGFTLDGAQLYQNKRSDTWIGIWILYDLSPDLRYKKKHILPSIVVPGPNKPKNIDSYLFRAFHHLSALQHENNGAGLRIWDASQKQVVDSRIVFALGMADAIGMVELDGRVGHHGARGCRLGCEMKGRHKPNSGHYYAAHLKPNSYTVEDCNHPDIDIRNLTTLTPEAYQHDIAKIIASADQTSYERNRKETGLSKPSILSGLVPELMVPLPGCFSVDLMHLLFINLGELLIPLWRGTLKCDPTDNKSTWDWISLTGDIWLEHGKRVADATHYFPSFFHRPPRNPAEKINSGFKATEYFLYLFGLGPGVFRTILPEHYWKNFCKLVRGVRIIIQRKISGAQLREAHSYFIQFIEEFENLYYQRRVDRLHFCRPCLHTLLHTAPEAIRVGPGAYSTQFTMERTIGDLGQEIKQPSNPFANLARRAIRRAEINSLKNMCPVLDQPDRISPKYSQNVGNGYQFRRPRDRSAYRIPGPEGIKLFEEFGMPKTTRWGRLQLPNGQVARSLWYESRRTKKRVRISRNVKLRRGLDRLTGFAEVQFYFLRLCDDSDELEPYALVSKYSDPDQQLLRESFGTLLVCNYCGSECLEVVKVSQIISVISMQPLPALPGEPEHRWFVVEKSGLDDVELSGNHEDNDSVNGEEE